MGKIKKVALIGLPNTGKSQIFNNLTGEYATVANYPGTTVEMKRAVTAINGENYEIIDTPGLHCLYMHSEEEIAVRDMIFTERPDVIIQCVDACQYKQSLFLTADLLELGIPMAIVLNSIDESAKKGIWIDSAGLERLFGVPVIESMAIRDLGREAIKKSIPGARKGKGYVSYTPEAEKNIEELSSVLPDDLVSKRKTASLLLLRDNYLEGYLEKNYGKEKLSDIRLELAKIRRSTKDNIRFIINEKRNEWAGRIAEATVKRHKLEVIRPSERFAEACRRPLSGIPILLAGMSVVYVSIVYVSGALDKFLNFLIVRPSLGAINAMALPPFWNDLLIGNHGILTLGFFNAVCTVLPILSVFFFIFGFFEDSGYIANFAVLSKNVFEKLGITGKAITSLVLGFGCKTMATLNTRGLSNYKEKLITIFLIAFAIPCSAQLGINMAILGRIGWTAFLIAFGTLAIFEFGAGIILNMVIKGDDDTSFIQMLPPTRFPDMKGVLIKTYYRIMIFLKEAIPIFIISAAFLFVFDKTGLLEMAKRALNPLMVNWMGLPRDIVDVFILALARREAAAGLIFQMVDAGKLNYIQSIVAVVVTTTFFPCFANVIAIGKELGVKSAIVISALVCLTSFVLAGMLNWLLVFFIGR